MRPFLLMLSLLVALVVPVQAAENAMSASASVSAPSAQDLSPFAAATPMPISYSAIPGRPRVTTNGLLIKVQSYDCRACRRTCVRDYKLDCDGSDGWCRRKFTACMRICWEDECR